MKFLLHSIYNKNTKEKVLEQYSNRLCKLSFEEDDTQMIIKFEKGGTLKHFEKVVDIFEDDGGVWVETTKKKWRFDNVCESIKDNKCLCEDW